VRALGKASYTHLIAFAMIRALAELPRVQSVFVEFDGVPYRRVPEHVDFGIAIDVPGPKGRMLVVPKIPAAETLSFTEFYNAYQALVARGREGQLTSEDFAGLSVTLTNPGGFGTSMSVPRLMPGQGLILAVGSIGGPPEVRGMSIANMAVNAIGPVMTVTATYDHRVIQGAESGLFLKRVDGLLQGADGFYDEIFRDMRVPWTPYAAQRDAHIPHEDMAEKQTRVWELINAYRVRGCRLADLDPLDAGVVSLRGRAAHEHAPDEWRRRVVYLHQDPVRLPGTVRDNLACVGHLRAQRGKVLEPVPGLDPDVDMTRLSGGEAQRLALHRALAIEPEVLLLDEAGSALDEDSARALEAHVRTWVEGGRAALWVAHDGGLAERLGARTVEFP